MTTYSIDVPEGFSELQSAEAAAYWLRSMRISILCGRFGSAWRRWRTPSAWRPRSLRGLSARVTGLSRPQGHL